MSAARVLRALLTIIFIVFCLRSYAQQEPPVPTVYAYDKRESVGHLENSILALRLEKGSPSAEDGADLPTGQRLLEMRSS